MILSNEDARALTDKIRSGLDDILPMIREAWRGNAHLALEYRTWETYCRAEFRGVTFPGDLAPAIILLHQDGMSGRAIGQALGVAESTARKYVREYRTSETARENAVARTTIKSANGREYPIGQPEVCTPVRGTATIKISPLHFGREAIKLAELIEAQHYGPDDLTADQADALMGLRDALKRFGEIFVEEELRVISDAA